MKTKLIAMMMPFALGACLGSVDTASLTTRSTSDGFGLPVTQAACEATAQRQIASHLREPRTARYTFGDCAPGTLGAMPLARLPRQKGYVINVSVEAKNGFGFYTDPIPYRVLIRDGQVIRRTVYDRRRARMVTF